MASGPRSDQLVVHRRLTNRLPVRSGGRLAPWRTILGSAPAVWLALLGALLAGPRAARGQLAAGERPPEPPASEAVGALDGWLDQLGAESYTQREAATEHVLALGEAMVPVLQARLAREADPEICLRLRFILDNIAPPEQAVLVIRSAAGGELQPGDLLTHVNNRRVRNHVELAQRLHEARVGYTLRVRRAAGPREIGPLYVAEPPVVCDYQRPRGDTIADAVRLFADGYAERAAELLRGLGEAVPDAELPDLLHAIIAYTGGDCATALRILAGHGGVEQPLSAYAPWSSPSRLDLAGPGKAPLHLEWRLWQARGPVGAEPGLDPDVAIQRVLVPARRFPEALEHAVALWCRDYGAQLGSDSDRDRIAGNTLAVSAWMLSELDLLSECLRLIEPRSAILRASPQGMHKWLRVQTDAWLPFMHGDPRRALDELYEDARAILQPPGPPANRLHILNPAVAATVGFFLYRLPADERTEEMLGLVNHRECAATAEYAYWMQYALDAGNYAQIRAALPKLLPNVPETQVAGVARAVALLEYVADRPDRDVLAAARERLADATNAVQPAEWSALLEALDLLVAGQLAEASAALERAGEAPGAAALRSTAGFMAAPPAGASSYAELSAPVLAVPVGPGKDGWLVLTRGRKLVHFSSAAAKLEVVEPPSPSWFPGPLNWPWLGRADPSGRVWVYDRRRVVEVCAGQSTPLRLNISPRDIPAFERYGSRMFAALAEALASGVATTAPSAEGECGEFWAADLRAGREFFVDPALPELGCLLELRDDPRIVHLAIRGGPQLLLDVPSGKTWSSQWVAQQLASQSPPTTRPVAAALWFLPQAAREQPSPVVFLMSSAGLLRLDIADEKLARIALPGDERAPAVIPESCPYERRDPRWVYCARRPDDGGRVFRVRVADNGVEALDLVNEAVPREYYLVPSRAALRRDIDARFLRAGLLPLSDFVADVERSIARYRTEGQP